MLGRIRAQRFFNWFWLFMALYQLNISADAPDTSPNAVCENLSYNDVETMTEWVLEEVLDIENAIPEHDDPDREDDESSGAKTLSQPHFLPESLTFQFAIYFAKKASLLPTHRLLKPSHKPEIALPPPEPAAYFC
jgi:hypothetical protein